LFCDSELEFDRQRYRSVSVQVEKESKEQRNKNKNKMGDQEDDDTGEFFFLSFLFSVPFFSVFSLLNPILRFFSPLLFSFSRCFLFSFVLSDFEDDQELRDFIDGNNENEALIRSQDVTSDLNATKKLIQARTTQREKRQEAKRKRDAILSSSTKGSYCILLLFIFNSPSLLSSSLFFSSRQRAIATKNKWIPYSRSSPNLSS
jgi:hypothetical protein